MSKHATMCQWFHDTTKKNIRPFWIVPMGRRS